MKPALTDFSHFLIIQTAFIGDSTLTLFVAQAIKKQNPTCKISIVSTPICEDILSVSTDVDHVFPFDKRNSQKGLQGIRTFAKQLSTEKIDCIISLHSSFRSSLLALLIPAQYKVTFTQSSFSLFFSRRTKRPEFGTERQRQLQLLHCFTDYIPTPYTEITFSLESQQKTIETFLETNLLEKNQFVILAPNSVWNEKRWGIEKFEKLCVNLLQKNIPIVVIGSKSEEQYCQILLSKIGVINGVGVFSLSEILFLLKQSAVLVSNDSAPIHLASVTNTPTIALFGPTIPEFGFAPLATKHTIFENRKLPCRPCSHNGSKPCYLGTHECMKSLKSEDITYEVFRYVESTSTP